MTNLKDVQKDPKKLEQFIKEREQDTPNADKEVFDKTLNSIIGGKKSEDRKS